MPSLESSIRWADGFLLLYSITQRLSFLEVPQLKRLIDQTKQNLGKWGGGQLLKGNIELLLKAEDLSGFRCKEKKSPSSMLRTKYSLQSFFIPLSRHKKVIVRLS